MVIRRARTRIVKSASPSIKNTAPYSAATRSKVAPLRGRLQDGLLKSKREATGQIDNPVAVDSGWLVRPNRVATR
jgi:hypothetical protein